MFGALSPGREKPLSRIMMRYHRQGSAAISIAASVRLRALSAAFLMLSAVLMATAAVANDADELQARLEQLQTLYSDAERDRLRLSAENARLDERLRTLDAQQAISRRLQEQAERLERVSQRLALDTAVREGPDHSVQPIAEDEALRLRTELDATQRRLQLLMDQFAEAHRMRLDALAQASAASEQLAESNARMRQQQQEMGEALLRAEKAEKRYAGLEDAHARILTENERLTLELSTAKERQAEALQRVVELNSQLATSRARAAAEQGSLSVSAADAEDAEDAQVAIEPSAPGTVQTAGPAPVVYQVLADDTLSLISAKVYGDPSAWRRIFEANRDLLDSPDDLALDMQLIIP
jgi:chromosome segregation ATPase